MARTTAALVRAILRDDYDGESDVSPFIASATVVVTRVAACAVAKLEPLTVEELELIERWLAAHYYGCTASNDRPIQEQTTEKAKGVFQGRTGMALESTYYGQVALTLDPSGCLAAVTKRTKARLTWAGLNPTDQTAYEDRR